MAVNQPKIGDDQTDNSWKLEVTTQANNEEARVNDLASRLAVLENMMGASGGGIVRQVDTSGILRFDATTGRLSNEPITSTGALQINNYVQLVSTTTRDYTFSGVGDLSTVPHQVFIGGQKLIETVDYTLPGPNGMIQLTSIPTPPPNNNNDFMIELTTWSL